MAIVLPVKAQSPPPTQFAKETEGLKVSVNSLVPKEQTLFVQFLIQNTTKDRKYIVLYGSGRASANNGMRGEANGATEVASCRFQPSDGDARALERCRKDVGSSLEGYTYIEPGEFVVAAIEFYSLGRNVLKDAQNVSFSLLGLLITKPVSTDPLLEKAPSSPKVVNINFPLIPLPAR